MPWLRRIALALGIGAGGLGSVATGVGWWLSAAPYDGPVSDHFDGAVFHNTEPTELPSLGRALGMVAEGAGPAWEDRRFLEREAPPAAVTGDALRATFVNHATVLVQHDGVNILTDPIWSERCSATQTLGPRRHHAPGVAMDALPRIDLVLVSHNHYDHLDVDTLEALARRDDPVLVVPLGNRGTVAGLGFSRVEELDWDQTVQVGPLTVTGQSVRHFSSRGLFDQQRTLWMGFVVEGPGARWYFSGDTGTGAHFAETGRAHGPFRLAILPIGAYAPRWFMGPIHMDPAEAVEATRALGAEHALGVHFGTFQLTREGQDDPVRELAEALDAAGIAPDRFVALEPGEALQVP